MCNKRGGNGRFELKARVLGTCSQRRAQCVCTSAAVFNFLHRRGGFAKSWTFIAPAVENAPPRTSSTTDGNLTVLTEQDRQLHTESPLFVMHGPGFATKALGTQFGRLSDSCRALLGRFPLIVVACHALRTFVHRRGGLCTFGACLPCWLACCCHCCCLPCPAHVCAQARRFRHCWCLLARLALSRQIQQIQMRPAMHCAKCTLCDYSGPGWGHMRI